MNISIRDIDVVTSYSGWPKVFVKYGVGNKENKNRRQRNADFAYILQRQGKTIISINKIMCSYVTTVHTWQLRLLRACVCFCMPKILAVREIDVTGL